MINEVQPSSKGEETEGLCLLLSTALAPFNECNSYRVTCAPELLPVLTGDRISLF